MQSPKQSQQLSPRQQQWHDEQKQFEASGLTARKFCQLHQLNQSTFYKRRERLAELSADNVAAGQHASMFIDAGSIDSSVKPRVCEPELVDSQAPPILELRIDLGAGITLTLTRH
jgi:hypothetical protein